MYKHILATIDLGHESSWKKVISTAVQMCEVSGASLHVMTVLPDMGMSIIGQYFPKGFESEAKEKALEQLKEFVSENVSDGIDVQHIVGVGTVYEVILNTAKTIEADLIIIGAHRPDLKDYLLGPNAARVVRHADCSVLVVRE